MKHLVCIALSFVFWLPLVALNAWVLTILWAWYMPILFGLPALSFEGAIGVSLVAHYLTRRKPNFKPKDPIEELIEDVVWGIMRPLLALFSGWVYISIWPV